MIVLSATSDTSSTLKSSRACSYWPVVGRSLAALEDRDLALRLGLLVLWDRQVEDSVSVFCIDLIGVDDK